MRGAPRSKSIVVDERFAMWRMPVRIFNLQGDVLIAPRFYSVQKLDNAMFWCVTTNEVRTQQGVVSQLAQLVSKTGKIVTTNAFEEYDDVPHYLPGVISEEAVFVHALGPGVAYPAIAYSDGMICKVNPEFWFEGYNSRIAYVESQGGDRLFDIASRLPVGKKYDHVIVTKNAALVSGHGKWRMVQLRENAVHDLLGMEYEKLLVKNLAMGLCEAINGDERGIVSDSGRWLVPLQSEWRFDNRPITSPDYIVVVDENGGKNILCATSRKPVFQKSFSDIECHSHQLAACVEAKGRSVLYDLKTGKPLNDAPVASSWFRPLAPWDVCSPFWQGVQDDDSFCFWIDSGKVIKLAAATVTAGGFDITNIVKIIDSSGESQGAFATKTGEVIIGIKNGRKVSPWADKILVSERNGDVFIVNSKGRRLLGQYDIDKLSHLDSSGYARIVCDGKAGLVDGDCNFVLPCQYEDVGHFGEGLVPAKQGGKWGFVALDDKWAIHARFEEARSFKGGYAPVCVGGKWGFIDKAGRAATPFEYEDVKDVREGHFRAKVNGKWGIFALDGRCTLPAEYDAILAEGEPGYGEM